MKTRRIFKKIHKKRLNKCKKKPQSKPKTKRSRYFLPLSSIFGDNHNLTKKYQEALN
jgi:hypothetical protein